jgi:hypothetical protein
MYVDESATRTQDRGERKCAIVSHEFVIVSYFLFCIQGQTFSLEWKQYIVHYRFSNKTNGDIVNLGSRSKTVLGKPNPNPKV